MICEILELKMSLKSSQKHHNGFSQQYHLHCASSSNLQKILTVGQQYILFSTMEKKLQREIRVTELLTVSAVEDLVAKLEE